MLRCLHGIRNVVLRGRTRCVTVTAQCTQSMCLLASSRATRVAAVSLVSMCAAGSAGSAEASERLERATPSPLLQLTSNNGCRDFATQERKKKKQKSKQLDGAQRNMRGKQWRRQGQGKRQGRVGGGQERAREDSAGMRAF